MFGADATKTFMETNGVRLVLRSHEGPDAREDRAGMNDMTSGFSLDHDVPGVGKLCTVFSAPDTRTWPRRASGDPTAEPPSSRSRRTRATTSRA